MASPLTAILKAVKKLTSEPRAVEQAMERAELLAQHTPLERYSPSMVARSALLEPAAQRGFSENLISNRAPFATTVMRPSEFLSRTPPLDTQRDELILEKLIPSIREQKLRDAPALWIDEYIGLAPQAGYEGRHRMRALQELYGDEPVPLSLIQGDRYQLSPSKWYPGEMQRDWAGSSALSPLELMQQQVLFGDRPINLSPLWMK